MRDPLPYISSARIYGIPNNTGPKTAWTRPMRHPSHLPRFTTKAVCTHLLLTVRPTKALPLGHSITRRSPCHPPLPPSQVPSQRRLRLPSPTGTYCSLLKKCSRAHPAARSRLARPILLPLSPSAPTLPSHLASDPDPSASAAFRQITLSKPVATLFAVRVVVVRATAAHSEPPTFT